MGYTLKLKKNYRFVAYGKSKLGMTDGEKAKNRQYITNMYEIQDTVGNELYYGGNLNMVIEKYGKYFTKTQLQDIKARYA